MQYQIWRYFIKFIFYQIWRYYGDLAISNFQHILIVEADTYFAIGNEIIIQ